MWLRGAGLPPYPPGQWPTPRDGTEGRLTLPAHGPLMQSPSPSPTPDVQAPEVVVPAPEAPYMDLLTSMHDQISAFLLFSAVVQVVVVFALGALVLGVLLRRG